MLRRDTVRMRCFWPARLVVHRMPKATAVSLLLCFSALASYLIYYDLVFFQPALASTRQRIQSEPPLQVSPVLEHYLESAYSQTIEFQAAKVLLHQSDFGGGDGWRSFLWGKLVDLHLSKQEQVAVVVSLAYMGSHRYGFTAASQARYEKSAEQLSPIEAATLVALMSAPSYYESRPEMLIERRDQLLAKAREYSR